MIAELRAEERAAAEALRRGRRLARAAAEARERAWRARLAEELRATRAAYPRCRCDLRRGMTAEELRALAGCKDPYYVCPRLDRVRRHLL
jgi:hypothetical protein